MNEKLYEYYKGLARTYRDYYYERREEKRIELLELIETLWARVEMLEPDEEDDELPSFLHDI